MTRFLDGPDTLVVLFEPDMSDPLNVVVVAAFKKTIDDTVYWGKGQSCCLSEEPRERAILEALSNMVVSVEHPKDREVI